MSWRGLCASRGTAASTCRAVQVIRISSQGADGGTHSTAPGQVEPLGTLGNAVRLLELLHDGLLSGTVTW